MSTALSTALTLPSVPCHAWQERCYLEAGANPTPVCFSSRDADTTDLRYALAAPSSPPLALFPQPSPQPSPRLTPLPTPCPTFPHRYKMNVDGPSSSLTDPHGVSAPPEYPGWKQPGLQVRSNLPPRCDLLPSSSVLVLL